MKPAIEDPIRLTSSSDDPLLQEALRAAGDELATSEQLAAVAAKLGPILGGGGSGGADFGGSSGPNIPPGGGASGGGTSAASFMSGASAKVALVLGAGALVSVGFFATRADDLPPPTKGALTPANVTASAPVSVASPTSAPPTASAIEETPPSPSVAIASPKTATLPREPRQAPPAQAPATPAPAPESEVKTLGRAQDALRSDPGLALSICDDHAKRFPNGLLPQEREVIAIDALTRLGKMDAARARARLFRAAHPSSSHLGRIEVLVGAGF